MLLLIAGTVLAVVAVASSRVGNNDVFICLPSGKKAGDEAGDEAEDEAGDRAGSGFIGVVISEFVVDELTGIALVEFSIALDALGRNVSPVVNPSVVLLDTNKNFNIKIIAKIT